MVGAAEQVDNLAPSFLPSFGKLPALNAAEAKNGAKSNAAIPWEIMPAVTSQGTSPPNGVDLQSSIQ